MKLLKLTLAGAASERLYIPTQAVVCYWKFGKATRLALIDGRWDVEESPKQILELIQQLEPETAVAGKGQD